MIVLNSIAAFFGKLLVLAGGRFPDSWTGIDDGLVVAVMLSILGALRLAFGRIYFTEKYLRGLQYTKAQRLLEACFDTEDVRENKVVANSRAKATIKKEIRTLGRELLSQDVMRREFNKAAEHKRLLNTVRLRIENELCSGTFGKKLYKGQLWAHENNPSDPDSDLPRDTKSITYDGSQTECIVISRLKSITDAAFKAGVNEYFRAAKQVGVEDPAQFVSIVDVQTGFIAPLLLLGGLLEHVDEDWTSIIDLFDADNLLYHAVLDTENEGGNLGALQAFIFDCWLIWGPSIPVCGEHCKRWTGTSTSILQYGFGDENSSIIIVGPKEYLYKQASEFKLPNALSFRARVKGRLRSSLFVEGAKPGTFAPPLLSSLNISPSLPPLDARSTSNRSGAHSRDRRLLLDVSDAARNLIEPTTAGEVTRYYSAYLWVMLIVMVRSDNELKPLDKHISPTTPEADRQQWRNFLPFFEHGNIADTDTYELLKAQLARKVVSTIERFAQARGWDGTQIQFAYACSIDNSGCHQGPTEIGLAYQGGEQSLSAIRRGRGEIREEIRRAIDASSYLRDRKNIINLDVFAKGDENPFAACFLPETIRKFYQYVDAQRPM